MNRNENSSEGKDALAPSHILNEDTETLIYEILKMDRLLYLGIIQAKGSLTSLQMTREILALKKDLKLEEVKTEAVSKGNPNINKRLKDLTELGILTDRGGEYSLSSIGFFIIDDLTRLNPNIEVLSMYKSFFDAHDYTVIPPQQFKEIYNLRFAKQCKDAIEYHKEIEENTVRVYHRLRIATERLHDIPGWTMEELKQGNLSLKLVYQFKEPFRINSDDEGERTLWRDLTENTSPTIELRYIKLENRNPIGIRIIDRKWAILNLLERAEKKLNRPRSFCGTDERFVSWVEDIFSNIWGISKPLSVDKIL